MLRGTFPAAGAEEEPQNESQARWLEWRRGEDRKPEGQQGAVQAQGVLTPAAPTPARGAFKGNTGAWNAPAEPGQVTQGSSNVPVPRGTDGL